MKRFLIAAGITVMLAGALYFVTAPKSDLRVERLVIETTGGAKHSFDVEIADTPLTQEIGLMFREHMEPDHGMLFVMPRTAMISFWMKNTLIPLDMLFIAPDGEIKNIHENAVPKSLVSISSGVPVSGVLELNGGRSKALGIAVGDRVIYSHFSVSTPQASDNAEKNTTQ